MTDPETKEHFVVNRIKAFKYAFKGAWLLLKNEPSIQVQSLCALVVTVLGFVYEISSVEWCIQLLAIGLVLAV
ncbi:MAG: diacylglycerol kinase family protein, partial [Bacteroidota bacterium]|nr:diacylglycerol kinase family protein [Bacteroidota bacterium]